MKSPREAQKPLIKRALPCALFCAAVLATIPSAHADLRGSGTELPTPPPQPAALSVRVERGQSVRIPLRTISPAVEGARFILRSRPASGTLALVEGSENTLLYTHSGDNAVRDSFLYAAQGLGTGVSGNGTVEITIYDRPPSLKATGRIDFGTFFAGESVSKSISLTNDGGGFLTVELEPPSGVEVDPARVPPIPPGKTETITVRLARLNPGGYTDHLVVVKPDGRHIVALLAHVTPPVEIIPGEIDLQTQARERSAVIVLANPTAQPREVLLAPIAGLDFPEKLRLEAGESTDFTIRAKPDATKGAIEGTLALQSGAYSRSLTVRAAALPPEIRVSPAGKLNLGTTTPERAVPFELEISNVGGIATTIRAQIPAGVEFPWGLEPRLLDPDASVKVPASAIPPADAEPGSTWTASLRLFGDWGEIGIPLTLIVAQPDSTETRTLRLRSAPSTGRPASGPNISTPDAAAGGDYGVREIVVPKRPPVARPEKPRILSINDTDVLLGWPDFKDATRFQIQRLKMRIEKERGLVGEWITWDAPISRGDNGQWTAKLPGLLRGELYLFRTVALKDGVPLDDPSPDLDIQLPKPSGIGWGWYTIAIVLLLSGGLGWVFLVRQQKSSQSNGAFRA